MFYQYQYSSSADISYLRYWDRVTYLRVSQFDHCLKWCHGTEKVTNLCPNLAWTNCDVNLTLGEKRQWNFSQNMKINRDIGFRKTLQECWFLPRLDPANDSPCKLKSIWGREDIFLKYRHWNDDINWKQNISKLYTNKVGLNISLLRMLFVST